MSSVEQQLRGWAPVIRPGDYFNQFMTSAIPPQLRTFRSGRSAEAPALLEGIPTDAFEAVGPDGFVDIAVEGEEI